MLRTLLLLLGLSVAGLLLITSPTPSIVSGKAGNSPVPTDIEPFQQRIKQTVLQKNQPVEILVSELDLFVSALLGYFDPGKHAMSQVRIEQRELRLLFDLPLDFWPSRYLNLDCRTDSFDKMVVTLACHLGNLPLPAISISQIKRWLPYGLQPWPALEFIPATLNKIDRIEVTTNSVNIYHHIDRQQVRATVAQGGSWLLSRIDHASVDPYNRRLQQLIDQADKSLSLAEALPVLFSLAMERSTAERSALQENSAAITAIALYAAGMSEPFVRDRDHPVALTLHQRSDLAQHYLLSALIVIRSIPQVAEWIGLQKELNDRREKSNDFSYPDLAADFSGVRFATLASSDEATARHLQKVISALPQEDAALMPAPRQLPRESSKSQFDPARHQQIELDIRAAIDRLPAYRLPSSPSPG